MSATKWVAGRLVAKYDRPVVFSDLILGILAGGALVMLWPHAVVAHAVEAPALVPPGEGMLAEPCPAEHASEQQPLAEPDQAASNYVAKMTYQKNFDWAWLCRFRRDNARIAQWPRPRAVFMGDSITEFWSLHDPGLFSHGIVDRGISGQTSPQMLLRFYQDVIALHPLVVHIMAGTNDIAGNTGPTSPDQFKNNIMAMVTLAQANHIRVVLASIPPSLRFGFHPSIRPAPRIAELNMWLRSYAAASGAVYADYYAVLAEPDGRIKDRYSSDGVHPDMLGYQVMRPVADAAIERALRLTQ